MKSRERLIMRRESCVWPDAGGFVLRISHPPHLSRSREEGAAGRRGVAGGFVRARRRRGGRGHGAGAPRAAAGGGGVDAVVPAAVLLHRAGVLHLLNGSA